MTPSTQTTETAKISTVDADEVARFAAIADTWWNTTGEFRPLHKLNPTRIAFIRDHVAAHFGIQNILWLPMCSVLLGIVVSLLLKETAPAVLQRRALVRPELATGEQSR
jgi:2-polyprenyl-3-methyl-5-hydroxy-6-metoxy-1,4-benzoquinol methylase